MRLRTVLVLSFLLATLVPTLTFGLSAYKNGLAREHEEVKDRHLLLAHNVSAALERYHIDVSAIFDALAVSLNEGKSMSNMHALMRGVNLNCVTLFDLAHGGGPVARTSVPGNKLKGIFGAERLAELAAETPQEGVNFSNVVDGGAAGNIMFVTRWVDGKLAVGTLSTQYFVELGESIAFGEKGHAAIIDKAGNVLAHPLPSWIKARKNIAKVSAAQRMMRGETGIETFFSPALKGDMIAGLTQVKGAGWGVMIPQPVSELEQKVVRNNIAIVFGLAIGIFIAFGLTFLFVRSLASPLESFLGTMKRNGRTGRLAETVIENGLLPIREIGHFATHYNSMVRRVSSANKRLQELAYGDSLTGLPNRVRLEQLAAPLLESDERGCLIFIDLDSFKEVNDVHGHNIGDAFLRQQSQRIEEAVQFLMGKRRGTKKWPKPIVARLGGDEFAVLVPGLARKDAATGFLTILQRLLSDPGADFDFLHRCGASMGCAFYPRDGSTLDELLKRADMAMYHAKQEGRNRFQIYNPQIGNLTLSELRHEVDCALENDDFQLVYQPQVCSRTHRLVGVEALIRWNHETYGFMAPDQWIPQIASSNLINRVGEWVIERAMQDHLYWSKQGHEIGVAVNVGAFHFGSEGFVNKLKAIAKKRRFDPSAMEIEITEDALFNATQEPEFVLSQLKAAGFRTAIDDFGTGYSNIARLSALPFDCLKIDRSVIDGAANGGRGAAVMKCITSMARELNCTMVAEGVEDTATCDLALKMGVEVLQGYHFSRPIDRSALLDWAQDHCPRSEAAKPAKPAKGTQSRRAAQPRGQATRKAA